MENYFKGSKEKPYHLSIGAVLVNDENKICCHYFKEIKPYRAYGVLKDFYILMRETINVNEGIEQALHRGLMEEFGATGEIKTFLGSIKSDFIIGDVTIEKTTLYFLVDLKSFEPKLRSFEDLEGESEIQWQTADFLIEKMENQMKRLNISSLYESEVVKRAKNYIK